jgi:hypothetical protein
VCLPVTIREPIRDAICFQFIASKPSARLKSNPWVQPKKEIMARVGPSLYGPMRPISSCCGVLTKLHTIDMLEHIDRTFRW